MIELPLLCRYRTAQMRLDYLRAHLAVKKFKVEEGRSRPSNLCGNSVLFAVTKKGILYLCEFPVYAIAILDEKIL